METYIVRPNGVRIIRLSPSQAEILFYLWHHGFIQYCRQTRLHQGERQYAITKGSQQSTSVSSAGILWQPAYHIVILFLFLKLEINKRRTALLAEC